MCDCWLFCFEWMLFYSIGKNFHAILLFPFPQKWISNDPKPQVQGSPGEF